MNLSPQNRIAGVLCPIFSLRREGDLGIGDTAALKEFVHWAADYGFRLVQLLPINETGPDNSPYNAVSSTALDPATLELHPGCPADLTKADFDELVTDGVRESLRGSAVNYRVVKPLKLQLLERAFQRFDRLAKPNSPRARRREEFAQIQKRWLSNYCLFRALMERFGTEMWDAWPEEVQTAASARQWMERLPARERQRFEKRMRFFAYVQMVAFEQWEKVRDEAISRGVALMGDVPIGVSYYSADVFSEPEIFDLEWSGGAPPERVFAADPFTVKWGQNWGVPLYKWDVMARDGYAWWRERVRTVREVFHLFRVDHILGFYRIYSFPWRPQRNEEFLPLEPEEAKQRTGGRLPGFRPRPDDTLEDREANRREGEQLLRVLLEEVGEYRLIGEDLGVVPDYVRPSLASLGIAGFKVPQWEKAHDGRLISGEHYAPLSICTYATHDHDPIRVMWESWAEIIRRADAGDASAQAAAGGARWEMQLIMDFAGFGQAAGAIPYDDSVRERLLSALFRTRSWIAVAMITDLLGLTQRINVPGAAADTNWSTRFDKTICEWREDPEVRRKMENILRLVQESGRA